MSKITKEARDAAEKELRAGLVPVMYQEPLILMALCQEEVLTSEAEVLDADLTKLGLSTRVRQQIYDHLSVRREYHKAELKGPGAYERLRAKARVRGLLPPMPGEPLSTGAEAKASAPSPSAPEAAHG